MLGLHDTGLGHLETHYSHDPVHQLVLHHGHRVDVYAVPQYAVECCPVHVRPGGSWECECESCGSCGCGYFAADRISPAASSCPRMYPSDV